MYFLGYIKIAPVLGTVYALLKFYEIILLIRIILSWVQLDPDNSLVRFLYDITDPLLDWLRSNIPIRLGMIDFSPLLAFAGLWLLEKLTIFLIFALRF